MLAHFFSTFVLYMNFSTRTKIGCMAFARSSLFGFALVLLLCDATALRGETRTASPELDVPIAVGPAIPLPIDGTVLQLWVSVAPDNPGRLLVCTFESDNAHARHISAAYVSLDAGGSWVRTLLDASSTWVSETSCASGSEGRAYFVASASDTSGGSPNHERGTTEAFRSLDGGLTWAVPRRYPFVDWTAVAAADGASISQRKVYLFGNSLANGFGDAGEGTWHGRRAMLAVSDDGLHFNSPIFPVLAGDQEKTGYYPITALALQDGSILALFAKLKQPRLESTYVLYQAEGADYGVLGAMKMPEGVHDIRFLAGQMAIDGRHGFPKRVYVAFTGVDHDRYALLLATSSDLGRTWVVRCLSHGPVAAANPERRSSFAAVAVNNQGIVGMEWLYPGGCPLFGVSADSGISLSASVRLGGCQEGQDLPLRPSSAKSQMWTITSPRGLSTFLDTSVPWSLKIAADVAGRFHLFWDEFDESGSFRLVTATAEAGFGAAVASVPIDARTLTELDGKVTFSLMDEQFDPFTATFDIDLVAENSDARILYPSYLAVSGSGTDCGELVYLNPIAKLENGNALFKISENSGDTGLRPGEQSLPIHIQIRVPGCDNVQSSIVALARKPRPPGSSLFRPLGIQFRVLEVLKTLCPSVSVEKGEAISNRK
jgi:hypothetical protein